MFIGDVGNELWEEVNFQPGGSTGGENYGWPCYEGNEDRGLTGCDPIETLTFPTYTYFHANGNCAITGGYVYRGSLYPAMQGHYVFADFCSDQFFSLSPTRNSEWQITDLGILINAWATTFGEDSEGTLYLGGHFENDIIYRLIPANE